ncbi:MAG: response regulator [Rhodospirillales bacterium]
MEQWHFKNIRLLMGEPRTDVRYGLRAVLEGAGFEHIEDASQVSIVRQSVMNNSVDLLICDTHLPDGDFEHLIHQIRHHEIGDNPFLNIITIIPAADEQTIKRVLNSGTDDIVVMPVSGGQLMDRVQHLIEERKPFVVTTDYIGPDRRNGPRPGTQTIPRIDVPNPLRAMVQERPDKDDLQAEIGAMVRVLNEMKIERHAYQIVYLVEKIAPADAPGPEVGNERAYLERLTWVTHDISRRVEGSLFADWSERCQTLTALMDRIRKAGMTVGENDSVALRGLAQGFKTDIAEEQRATQFA